ncbi:putative kinetochore protein [Golovinomyces cichoracearum]|uniref:Putative kinetochore protein n=1 Tax=Golovinomyces cichoracearum TaxID=62708 RepID=A0A420IEF9_9PEZI|nr:putative kinetochore protein [Golovinomyces cichoracearum]
MTEFQRKIELQSLDDLQYLVSNLRRAAYGKIEQDLPSIEGEDPMRMCVESIVSQFIEDIVKSVSSNITINGLEPTQSSLDTIIKSKVNTTATEIEEYEPFDSRLFQKAQKLAHQEEDLIEEIATLRRTIPRQLITSTKAEFKDSLEKDESLLKSLEDHLKTSQTTSANLGLVALERQDAIERDWNKGVQGLGALMRSLPEMVAKKSRADEVEKYVTQKI